MNTSFVKSNLVKNKSMPFNVEKVSKKINVAILISKNSKSFSSPEDKRMSDHYKYDEQALYLELESKNISYKEVIWDDKNINWAQFDIAIIRSTWDYHEGKHDLFLKTLKKIEAAGVKLFNSFKTVEWNSKKTYLQDLDLAGIPILPTIFATHKTYPNIQEELVKRGWNECVLKPAISCGAYKTFKVSSPEEANAIYKSSFSSSEIILIQPFAHEITNEGEWSHIFFNGKYSHSVLKKTPHGDFRVQLFFGNKEQVPDWMIKDATNIFDKVKSIIKEIPLYARIDTINRNSSLHVMEIELIEPYLYLQTKEDAPEKLIAPIRSYLETQN